MISQIFQQSFNIPIINIKLRKRKERLQHQMVIWCNFLVIYLMTESIFHTEFETFSSNEAFQLLGSEGLDFQTLNNLVGAKKQQNIPSLILWELIRELSCHKINDCKANRSQICIYIYIGFVTRGESQKANGKGRANTHLANYQST